MARIAIVDDEKDILDMLGRFLSRRFEVEMFQNPITALNNIKNNDYDLVLSDIMMPQMDGIELLKNIKSIKPDIKVIMMTAFDTLDRALKAHEFGASNYIKKPFDSLKEVEYIINNEIN